MKECEFDTDKIPLGIQDFKTIRRNNRYYVDKTDLISRLAPNEGDVYLFTRPRRFGKSLNLSMLDAFFNIDYKGNSWFDGLKISGRKDLENHKNAYPVVLFDFKELDVSDYKEFQASIAVKISRFYRRYSVLNSSERLLPSEKNLLESIQSENGTPKQVEDALSSLVELLEKHYGTKVVVLFDEYDNPIHRSYGSKHQKDILEYMKRMLSSVLKGNSSVQLAVVTGVMQIAKESIFSGLNNISVNNIFSTDCDESFGFTDAEVKKLCTDFGHPEKYDEAKEWYHGYRFGNADVYNPWSVLKYVKSGFEPDCYWAGTSGNDIIGSMLERRSIETDEYLRKLSEGYPISIDIDPSLTFMDLQNPDNVFNVMAVSGYLTAERNGGDYVLSIPNGEMYKVFGKLIINPMLARGSNRVWRFVDSLLSNNVPGMKKSLGDLFKLTAGFNMLHDERSYQAYITGMLMSLSGRFTVRAEYEAGNGRCDIRLESKTFRHPHVVIEIKKNDSSASPEKAMESAKEAIEQILFKDYTHGLKGEIILYGVAFAGKEPYVESKVLNNVNSELDHGI